MAGNLKGRHFLKLLDFTAAEMGDLLELSATLKRNKRAGVRTRSLDGKSIARVAPQFRKTLPGLVLMIFQPVRIQLC